MFNLKCTLTIIVLIATVSARTTNTYQQNAIPHGDEEKNRAASSSATTTFLSPEIAPYFGDLRFLYKIYQECSTGEMSTCLKMKLVAGLDRVSRQLNQLSLIDGVYLVKDSNVIDTSTPIKSEADLEATLPRALDERDNRLNSMIFGKIIDFFKTHSLQIKLPSLLENEERSLNVDEARGKKKNKGMMMMIPMMVGGMLTSIALGLLFLLAGKALLVGKLALVIASMVGLKKLFSNGGGGHENVEVVASPAHASGGWARSFDDNTAQQLAYKAYYNQQTKKEQ